MAISHFIFDLDGTLSDPLQGMAASLNHALQSHGFESRAHEELATFVGPPLEGAITALTGNDDPDHIASMVASYRELYVAEGYAQNAVYPGIREMLDALRHEGFALGVCTSKPEKTARKILRHFSLESSFEFVSGGDVGVKKSQQLEKLLREQLIDRHALMIGDRDVDIVAAKSNQLRSAAVEWGYGSGEELAQAAPDFRFAQPVDVLHLARNPVSLPADVYPVEPRQ